MNMGHCRFGGFIDHADNVLVYIKDDGVLRSWAWTSDRKPQYDSSEFQEEVCDRPFDLSVDQGSDQYSFQTAVRKTKRE